MQFDQWISEESERVNRIRSELRLARRAVKEERKELVQARKAEKTALEARTVLVGMAQAVQQKAHDRIAAVVSSCLSAVFDDPYEFKIHFEQKRGRTEARLVFMRAGFEVDPTDAAGGGMVDVAAFALRAACLVLHRPRLRQLLVLDEPFRFVSAGYRPAVRTMLEELSRDLKLQIIMVTHSEELEIGKVVTV